MAAMGRGYITWMGIKADGVCLFVMGGGAGHTEWRTGQHSAIVLVAAAMAGNVPVQAEGTIPDREGETRADVEFIEAQPRMDPTVPFIG
jgi:hypothetical protein